MDLGALLAGRNEFDYTLDDAFFQALDQDVILDSGEKISVSKRNKKILVSQYLNQVVAIKRGGLHT